MKITVGTSGTIPAARLAQRLRSEILSSGTVERFQRELEDELDAITVSERTAEDRRDALERAVRRVWGATL